MECSKRLMRVVFSRMPNVDGEARVGRLYAVGGRAQPLASRTHFLQMCLARETLNVDRRDDEKEGSGSRVVKERSGGQEREVR